MVLVQSGLQSYLSGQTGKSANIYARGAELGYPSALYNLAWLYRRTLSHARVYHAATFAMVRRAP